jgi:hypothetical protein
MTLRTDILTNYTDANGLVCNRRCLPTEVNPSGNGVCYTGEYVTLLALRRELQDADRDAYAAIISKCIKPTGELTRGPGQPDMEGPDDYYGLAAGCQVTGSRDLVKEVLNYSFKPFNYHPQLIAALYAASGSTPWYIYPLRGYAALIIATSCIFADKADSDARRLSWLLIQALSPVSFTCRLASKLWYKRLYKTYGPDGMRAVAAQYYEAGHPFIQYQESKS